MKHARMNKNRELWETRFEEYNTHTTEISVLGRRVILTADPENIKAILAGQFYDFGIFPSTTSNPQTHL